MFEPQGRDSGVHACEPSCVRVRDPGPLPLAVVCCRARLRPRASVPAALERRARRVASQTEPAGPGREQTLKSARGGTSSALPSDACLCGPRTPAPSRAQRQPCANSRGVKGRPLLWSCSLPGDGRSCGAPPCSWPRPLRFICSDALATLTTPARQACGVTRS